jgi:hypothetical protein
VLWGKSRLFLKIFMPRKPKPLYTTVIDTREQNPYKFGTPHRRELEDGGVVTYKLDEGDYAVELDGQLLPVRVERKSITDFYAVVGRERERFAGIKNGLYYGGESELLRLNRFASYLIIEATIDEVYHGIERSRIPGQAAIGSVFCWTVKYGVMPIFAGNWRNGNAICRRILEEFAVHWLQK